MYDVDFPQIARLEAGRIEFHTQRRAVKLAVWKGRDFDSILASLMLKHNRISKRCRSPEPCDILGGHLPETLVFYPSLTHRRGA
jgi:hypothetical protein